MAEQAPKFVFGDGQVYDARSAEEAAKYRDMGLHELSPEEVRLDSLKQQYSGWEGAVAAPFVGAMQAVPFLTSAVTGAESLISPEAAKNTADFISAENAAHPLLTGAGMLGGAVLGGVGGVAKAGLTGLGIGATKAAAAVGGAEGFGYGLDHLALQHIQSPEGSEKVGATLGLSTLLGAFLGAGGQKLAEALGAGELGALGKRMEKSGTEEALKRSSNPMGNPGVAARLEEKGATSDAMALAQKYNLLDKAPREFAARVKDIQKKAEQVLNQAKATSTQVLPLEDHVAFSEKLRSLLPSKLFKSSGREIATELGDVNATEVGPLLKAQSVEELHQLRIKVDKLIDREGAKSMASEKLSQARTLISDQIEKTLQANATKEPGLADQMGRWLAANKDYSAAMSLKDALRYSEETGRSLVGSLAGKVSTYGQGSAIFGALAGHPTVAAAGAGAYLAGKGVQAFSESPAIPRAVAGLGKVLQKFDARVVQGIATKLDAKGPSVSDATQRLFTLADYGTLSAFAKHVSETPQESMVRLAQHLEDQGVPGPVVDSAIPQVVKSVQYLSSVMPKDPCLGTSVSPFACPPTLAQKTQFVDAANAVHDPAWALQNPTPARLAAVRAVYPILASKTAQIAGQEASTRPLSPFARKWAALMTDRPATPLAAPAYQATMLLSKQKLAQKQAPQGGGHKQAPAGGNIIASSQTRLDRMSSE